jgi:hypothetical protein
MCTQTLTDISFFVDEEDELIAYIIWATEMVHVRAGDNFTARKKKKDKDWESVSLCAWRAVMWFEGCLSDPFVISIFHPQVKLFFIFHSSILSQLFLLSSAGRMSKTVNYLWVRWMWYDSHQGHRSVSLPSSHFWGPSGFLGSEYHHKILSFNKSPAACI